jgi:hypothetical protein
MSIQSAQRTEILSNKHLLKFLAAVIALWINIINDRLNQGDCALLMMDSMTAERWMKKSSFIKPNDNPIQATTRINGARHYAKLVMVADVKGYSQWFEGKLNNVPDALLQDWHCSNNKLTFILRSHFPEQVPEYFETSPLPSKISSWLTSMLQRLPVNTLLQEHHKTKEIKLGGSGSNTVNLSDVTTFTWKDSPRKKEFSCWELLPWLSEKEDFCRNTMNVWIREQSEALYPMWCRPSGQRADQTPQRTQIANLASFYQGSSEPTETTIPSKSSKRPYHLLYSMK